MAGIEWQCNQLSALPTGHGVCAYHPAQLADKGGTTPRCAKALLGHFSAPGLKESMFSATSRGLLPNPPARRIERDIGKCRYGRSKHAWIKLIGLTMTIRARRGGNCAASYRRTQVETTPANNSST